MHGIIQQRIHACMHAKKESEVNLRLQVWSEFVNPSKAARFSCSWQQAFGSNGAPLPWTILSHMSLKHFIFLSTPWPLLHIPSLQLSFHFQCFFLNLLLPPLYIFQMDMQAFAPLCSRSSLLMHFLL